MQVEEIYEKAKYGNKRARKRLEKKYPKTFNVLLEEEKEERDKEEAKKKKYEEELKIKKEEEKKRLDEENKKKAEEEKRKQIERERKICAIKEILLFKEGDENKVGSLKEFVMQRIETPILGEATKGPSAWGIVEYRERLGTDIRYKKMQRREEKRTKREALIISILEGEKISLKNDEDSLLVFEESEDKVFQAQVDDILNSHYEGDGIFTVRLDSIRYDIPCDNRILRTFSGRKISYAEYKEKGIISFANIKRAIKRFHNMEER